ncbi:MAG: NAD(P)-dependent alcohol dehydrogenase [Anaerolineaceae bacterium]|nr:NAD(P)-dependent alcohol dehydrogenase [Anaerolineaceae bacterium]
MKAVKWTQYGPPEGLQLGEAEKPTPKDNEVLVKIHAASVTAGDCEIRASNVPAWLWLPIRLFTGLTKPRKNITLGQELAGEVEAVGKGVTEFKVGDAVFAATGFSFGGYAEYVCLPAESDDSVLASKPSNVSYEEAAVVPVAGLEALHFLSAAHIQRGESVLILGAGGSIGTFGLQLARHHGAEVTAVDSAGKLDFLRSIGADQVIDYAQEDFTRNGQQYDVIFDVIGKSHYARSLQALKPGGRYLLPNAGPAEMLRGRWTSLTSDKKIIVGPARRNPADLNRLKELIEAGTIKPVIDQIYPLEQIAAAHRYADSGQKQGNIAITVSSG